MDPWDNVALIVEQYPDRCGKTTNIIGFTEWHKSSLYKWEKFGIGNHQGTML